MKLTKKSKWLSLIAAGLFLTCSACLVQAQPYPNYIADQFDTDTTGSLQNQGWGSAVPVIDWSTNNALTTMGPNIAGSGSAEFQISWPLPNGDQVMVANWFDGSGDVINLNDYTNVSFDIMFPTNCGTDGNGSYGIVEIGCIPTADGWPSTALGDYTSAVSNGNGWIHVSFPLDAAAVQKEDAVEGYYVKVQQSRTGGNLTNTIFYIDNVIFGGLTNLPPPPTMSISRNPSAPGLMILCGGSGGTYTRGLMAALDVVNTTRNFSWVGMGSTPVTYSQTIVNYPGTNNPIQSVIFLVQNGQLGDPGVDYDAANVAELSMYGNADGTATASFTYKTNEPDGNSQFGPNTFETLTAPSPLGTWSLTFLDDTNVTLSWAPLSGGSGLGTNADFPSETLVQTYFANPLTVFMGNQQNADANLGQFSTYSEFKIGGVTASPSLDDVWSNQSTLDTTNWAIVNYAASDNILVHSTDKYWVSWSLPDAGFSPNWSTNLAAGANGWTDAQVSQIVSTTTNAQVLLPGYSGNYPGGGKVYFSLIQRTYTQLQVLWPGQTNAPGTVSGYVGSPTPVNSGDNVTVTVNACDNTWHIVDSVNDTISLGSGTAITPSPAAMVDGAGQQTVVFTSAGSGQTVTATDTTDTNIPPVISAPITVN